MIAIKIARQAGGFLRAGHRYITTAVGDDGYEALQINYKSRADLVTEWDLASEGLIVAALREHFPDHAIVAEEGGGSRLAGPTWLVDPLDGTTNFAHGYPVFAVTLALLMEDQPVLGVVYDPLRDECFAAEHGQGAWLNDRRLHVSDTPLLERALLSTGFPYNRWSDPHNNVREHSTMIMRCQGIVRSGSAALDFAYVAAGRSDGHWELGLRPWDTAAGALLVAEAGGTVSDWRGGAYSPWYDRVVATNVHLHAQVLETLASVQAQ